MKTELAFERQKKVVMGLEAALRFVTARTIAGCWAEYEDGLMISTVY
jgi:hypothetical protein